MSRICRISAVALVSLVLGSSAAQGLELKWSNGTSDLEFFEATRCTLVVQASDAEGRLADKWRLQWVSDTTISFVPISGPDSCGLGVALLSDLSSPSGGVELNAGEETARFCSLGSGYVYLAKYVLDLPEGARGKLKVIAIDPSNSTGDHVIKSSDARFNSGVAAPFAPAILKIQTTHESLQYELKLIGSGLQAVDSAYIVAPDESWTAALAITSLSDTLLNATASLAAWVPDCKILLHTTDGRLATESVPADAAPRPLESSAACQARFIEDIYPPAMIQPKDFAFVPGGWSATGSWTFHLFYIRQNQVIKSLSGADATEKNLGHAVSNNLGSWTVLDTAAIAVRPNRFDSQHVWAPTIVRKGVTYYMFYTGVDALNRQRIGIATSTDLVHWAQGDSVITRENAGSWVSQTSNDLRDPFVMEDPASPGHWLMYFTTQPNDPGFTGLLAGFIRSSDVTFAPAALSAGGALWRSQQNRQSGLESPHVFNRSGKWWLFFTKPVATQDTIYAMSSANPSSTTISDWSIISSIRDLVPLSEATAYTFWHGTEYLKIAGSGAGKEYLAGFNDSDQSISYTQMRDVPSPYLFGGDCPTAAGVNDGPVLVDHPELRALNAGFSRGVLAFAVFPPTSGRATVSIFDVFGRRVATLVDAELPVGRTTLRWEGVGRNGEPAASGIYFATLSFGESGRTVRVPFLR